MRNSVLSLALICSLLLAGQAGAHGIPLAVAADDQGKLYSPSLVTFEFHDSALTPFPEGAPTLLRGTAGFYPVFGDGIPAGTVLTVDAAGSAKHPSALAFWDGANVVPSPVAFTISRSSFSIDVSPTDEFVAGGPLGAYNGEVGGHSSVTLALPLDAPTGLYAVGFQVSSPGFERSETFWAVANNGLAPEEVPAGLRALKSAVPEPSTWALGLLGIGALLTCEIRRRRKVRLVA